MSDPVTESKRTSVQNLKDRLGTNASPQEVLLLDNLEKWDTNGDGHYSAEEVFEAVKLYNAATAQVKSLKKLLLLGAVAAVVVLGAFLAVGVAGNELAKDMRPAASGVMTTTDGVTVGTAKATASAALEDLARIPDDALSNMEVLSVVHDENLYVLKVNGYMRASDEEVVFFFATNPLASTLRVADGEVFLGLLDAGDGSRRLKYVASVNLFHGVQLFGMWGRTAQPFM